METQSIEQIVNEAGNKKTAAFADAWETYQEAVRLADDQMPNYIYTYHTTDEREARFRQYRDECAAKKKIALNIYTEKTNIALAMYYQEIAEGVERKPTSNQVLMTP